MDIWSDNTNLPLNNQEITYRDISGNIRVGRFKPFGNPWIVSNIDGTGITEWRNVVEWKKFYPCAYDVWYINLLIVEIESELG